MQREFWDNIYNSISIGLLNGLNETLHIVNNFDDCINDIYNFWLLKKGHISGIKTTGWYFNIKTATCEKNNNNESYEIYIEFINDFNANSGYNKIRGIDIDINNKKIIVGYNNFKGNINTIKATLKHEFTHIREQYAKEHINVIFNKKNMADNINNIFNIEDINFIYIKDILYFLMPTEQHARINGIYEFLKNILFSEIVNIIKNKKFYSLYDTYKYLILYYDRFTLAQSFITTLNQIKNDNKLMIYLGYYINLLNLNRFNINNNNIKKIIKNPDKILILNIFNYLKNNYIQYIKKIIDSISNLFNNNGYLEKIFNIQFK